MDRLLLAVSIILVFSILASAQAVFPGLTPETKKRLAAAKRPTAFALPTWLPAGFTVNRAQMNLGPRVKIEDKWLVIVCSRKFADGRSRRFEIDAGFDGLGDLMYDGGKRLRTPVDEV